MPTRSPGDAPAGSLEELGLPGRAVTALTRAGVTSAAELAGLTRAELAAVPGLGPGTVAAIRRVVPEPDAAAAEEESPAAPAIPSFASLRDPRRRTAVDLIVPATPHPADRAATRPGEPAAAPSGPRAAARPATGPRPAEYADLLRLGARVVRAAAGVPLRMAGWPVRCLRRLVGGQPG
ncbi:DNA-directed RNA polymerase subunit alpha C-terminal domain-containing protein [Geodermatophilus sabuli]|uniref:RNA polymerase, alpha chain C terminal domain n=1 Tax=Geodermatophilus sabuli TaxID=1564158 RepID=A0A285EHV0_9ACTN|nr:DNA-directed RNA polymerase subunit alpha C-terminal domain-containing protein [Geodermatophilus sabuli]MBB3083929.1 putative flap endonuclease-1-like 5' DNA nuclease [Geodermatophilus sabuli]SNX98577.1 RNA polymerase, alpha chain C terminal domain [Geodermatophilus sabuli]